MGKVIPAADRIKMHQEAGHTLTVQNIQSLKTHRWLVLCDCDQKIWATGIDIRATGMQG